MFLIAASAAFVGLMHSMSPGHWLPVVLLVKARRWPPQKAVLGALVTASGHVLISSIFALVAIGIGSHIFASHEEVIEKYSGLALIAFGLIYAFYSYKRHSACGHAHSHHGPNPALSKTPYLFLFSLGLSPCVAVLPVLGVAATRSSVTAIVSVAAFSGGVICSLVGATLLVSSGLVKLDHPILEHYGDVIAGFGIAVMGAVLFLI